MLQLGSLLHNIFTLFLFFLIIHRFGYYNILPVVYLSSFNSVGLKPFFTYDSFVTTRIGYVYNIVCLFLFVNYHRPKTLYYSHLRSIDFQFEFVTKITISTYIRFETSEPLQVLQIVY